MALITLTRGYFAEVDDADFEAVNTHKWHVVICRHTCYAKRRATISGRSGNQFMHHFILPDAPPGLDIDHFDGNGLNNRRSNLRSMTRAQNIWKARRPAEHDGVYQHAQTGKWRSRVSHLGERINAGTFGTKEEALAARVFLIAVLREAAEIPQFDPMRLPPIARKLALERL